MAIEILPVAQIYPIKTILILFVYLFSHNETKKVV